ncbi:hypothetical protein K402DRAFT_407045 [Aulographum hederae CBS 113979]|uniref:Uncharacterized protein n=1 Tax=Aulographum hederae CBS 113979 TaxID=1176131 RepID=A0A6G1GQV0_9PEZI|nr:hypothetical protein K402DRAFT_407045 [Aulographum hederae CBS 113979]
MVVQQDRQDEANQGPPPFSSRKGPPSQLQSNARASWVKAAAIRRGDLKISAPIPWEDDDASKKPSTDHIRDDRNHSRSKLDEPTMLPQERPSTAASSVHPLDERTSRQKRSMQASRERNMPQHTPRVSTATFDSPKSTPSKVDSSAMRRRKSVALKSVIRKMFGKKAKGEDRPEPETTLHSNASHHAYHRSDPAHMHDPSILYEHDEPAEHQVSSHQRMLSMPAQELKAKSSMGSHLPFPMNVNAPEVASPASHHYLSFETSPVVHRRRATLPSVVLSPGDIAALNAMWSEPGVARMSSYREQFGLVTPEPDIGVALSSGDRYRRRSRSADALQDMIRAESGTDNLRRRSEEIAQWTTYNSPSQPVPESNSEVSLVVDEKEGEQEREAHDSTIAPGNEYMNRSVSPEEAEEPIAYDEPTVMTERRLSQLETSMRTLEQSVQKLSGRSNRQTLVLENPPKQGRRSRPSKSSVDLRRDSPSSSDSGIARSKSHRSRHPSSFTFHPEGGSHYSSQAQPPFLLSSSTDGARDFHLTRSELQHNEYSPGDSGLTGSTGIPISTPQGSAMSSPNVYDQLAPLYTALRHERSVRKNLETQVTQLQHDLHELVNFLRYTHPVASAQALQFAYPTLSPDQLPGSGGDGGSEAMERRLEDKRIEQSLRQGAMMHTSRFSGLDTDTTTDDAESEGEIGPDGEMWKTPRENITPQTSGGYSVPHSRERVF